MLTMDRGTALTVRPRTISPIPAGSRILDDARLDTIAGSLLRIRADGKTRRIARALEPPHHRSRKSEQGIGQDGNARPMAPEASC